MVIGLGLGVLGHGFSVWFLRCCSYVFVEENMHPGVVEETFVEFKNPFPPVTDCHTLKTYYYGSRFPEFSIFTQSIDTTVGKLCIKKHEVYLI